MPGGKGYGRLVIMMLKCRELTRMIASDELPEAR